VNDAVPSDVVAAVGPRAGERGPGPPGKRSRATLVGAPFPGRAAVRAASTTPRRGRLLTSASSILFCSSSSILFWRPSILQKSAIDPGDGHQHFGRGGAPGCGRGIRATTQEDTVLHVHKTHRRHVRDGRGAGWWAKIAVCCSHAPRPPCRGFLGISSQSLLLRRPQSRRHIGHRALLHSGASSATAAPRRASQGRFPFERTHKTGLLARSSILPRKR